MYLHISHILKLQIGISVSHVSAVFKIILCGLNLNYGKTNSMRFDNESYKIELRNEIFRKVNEKGGKKKQKKKWQGSGRESLTLLGMEAITSRKTRNYKEKT